MKRVISFVMVLVVCLSLCACKEATVEPTVPPTTESTEPKEIILTTDNINEYLVMKVKFEGSTVSIETYPIVGGSFNNVELVLNVYLGDPWFKISPNDPSYKYSIAAIPNVPEGDYWEDFSPENYVLTRIKLPADGKYTESHKFISTTWAHEDEEYEIVYGESIYRNGIITALSSEYFPKGTPHVTGTFIPN